MDVIQNEGAQYLCYSHLHLQNDCPKGSPSSWGTPKSHREQGLNCFEGERQFWCTSLSSTWLPGEDSGLVYFPGVGVTIPTERALDFCFVLFVDRLARENWVDVDEVCVVKKRDHPELFGGLALSDFQLDILSLDLWSITLEPAFITGQQRLKYSWSGGNDHQPPCCCHQCVFHSVHQWAPWEETLYKFWWGCSYLRSSDIYCLFAHTTIFIQKF